jgi:membrane-bound lytic murein transglycosylase MltF
MTKPKRHPSLYFLAAFVAFWGLFALFYSIREANKAAGDFPMIQKTGILRVCGEEDLFSFYSDENGTHGFHYETAKAFADRHHLKLVYKSEASLNKRLKMLKDEKCDILTGPLPVTGSLKEKVAFTQTILESKLVLIQRRDAKNRPNELVRNIVNFGGKRIHTCDNPAYIERLHHLAAEISDTIHIQKMSSADNEKLIALVASGLIDYAVCDKHVAKAYRERYPSVDVNTPIGFNQLQAWAVKPGRNILLDSLNSFIQEYQKSPEFTRLLEKYIPD